MLLSAPSPHHQPQSLHLNKENSQPRRVSSRHRSTTSSKLLLSSAVPKSTRTSTLKPHLSSGSPYARTPSTPPASPKKKTSKLSSSLKTPVASSPARTSSSRSQQASVGLVNAPPITSSSSSLSSRMPTSEEQHQMRYGGPVVMDRGSGSSFLPLSLPRPERVAQIDVPTVEELEGVVSRHLCHLPSLLLSPEAEFLFRVVSPSPTHTFLSASPNLDPPSSSPPSPPTSPTDPAPSPLLCPPASRSTTTPRRRSTLSPCTLLPRPTTSSPSDPHPLHPPLPLQQLGPFSPSTPSSTRPSAPTFLLSLLATANSRSRRCPSSTSRSPHPQRSRRSTLTSTPSARTSSSPRSSLFQPAPLRQRGHAQISQPNSQRGSTSRS